ncbi:Serine/threonine-protein kinase 19, partial [Rhizophlyctis rosea]
LLAQLYCAVGDHTRVDVDVDSLCQSGVLRRFVRSGDVREGCLMLSMDYEAQILGLAKEERGGDGRRGQEGDAESTQDGDRRKRRRVNGDGIHRGGDDMDGVEVGNDLALGGGESSGGSIFDRYANLVKSSHHSETSISETDLRKGASATKEEISKLLTAGFLTIKTSTSYHFSVRSAGPFWSSFHKSRSEIIQALKRAKYQEILERTLTERKLRFGNGLSAKLIVMELLGTGVVER